MNNINYLLQTFSITFFGILMLSSCEKKDPVIPNEEELITTMIYKLTPVGGGDVVTFYFQDLDGDGGNAPIITSDPLLANTSYTGILQLLNETEMPAGDITAEVEKEGEHHQFFFTVDGNAIDNTVIAYNDEDVNGNPLGISTTFTASDASSGTLSIVLRHQPLKPNDGSLVDAGGQTDIQVIFDLIIQ